MESKQCCLIASLQRLLSFYLLMLPLPKPLLLISLFLSFHPSLFTLSLSPFHHSLSPYVSVFPLWTSGRSPDESELPDQRPWHPPPRSVSHCTHGTTVPSGPLDCDTVDLPQYLRVIVVFFLSCCWDAIFYLVTLGKWIIKCGFPHNSPSMILSSKWWKLLMLKKNPLAAIEYAQSVSSQEHGSS